MDPVELVVGVVTGGGADDGGAGEVGERVGGAMLSRGD